MMEYSRQMQCVSLLTPAFDGGDGERATGRSSSGRQRLPLPLRLRLPTPPPEAEHACTAELSSERPNSRSSRVPFWTPPRKSQSTKKWLLSFESVAQLSKVHESVNPGLDPCKSTRKINPTPGQIIGFERVRSKATMEYHPS